AAVIGKTFWRGVLGSVAPGLDVEDALHVLEARDFVHRDASSQLASDVQYTFKHMLIREVAYSTLPRAVRRERHAAVAQYIEDALAGESLSTILAYHWREAGEPARAIPYLLDVAAAAWRSWDGCGRRWTEPGTCDAGRRGRPRRRARARRPFARAVGG